MLPLHRNNLLQTDQFQKGQEGHDHFGAAGGIGEKLGELQDQLVLQGLEEALNFFADRPFILKDVAQILALVDALEDEVDSVDEVEKGGIRSEFGLGLEFRFDWQPGIGVFRSEERRVGKEWR